MTDQLDHDTREKIRSLYLLSRDASTTEHERAEAKRQLDRLLAELGLSLADAERINAEATSATAPEEPLCTPRELVMIIIDLLQQYVWHPDEQVFLLVALWILHTHCYRQFRHTPRFIIYALLSNSGKTTLMTIIRFLSAGGIKLVDPSSPSLFREIHQGINDTGDYTAFVDQMNRAKFDSLFYQIFDEGWVEGGQITRVINGESVRFDVCAPMCFSSISKAKFDEQNQTRSFLLKLKKKGARKVARRLLSEITPTEDISDVRHLIDDWARSVRGNEIGTLTREPPLPSHLVDRDEDRWIPLISIADACGFGAEVRAMAASPAFAIAQADLKIDLIMDIRKVRDGLKRPPFDRIWSKDLLLDIHESPWDEWCGLDGKKAPHRLGERELGHILRKEWEIKSGSVRIGNKTAKGYYFEHFESAWEQAGLPSSTALAPRKPSKRKRHSGSKRKPSKRKRAKRK